jgi:hypothetical protein
MKSLFAKLSVAFVFAFLMVANAFAVPLGLDITAYDGSSAPGSTSSDTTWWNNKNEDQEVEPKCTTGQAWDLEGFFIQGNTLTIVGGFNFVSGSSTYPSGDLFIDTDGNTANGYSYVYDLDFANLSYKIWTGNYSVDNVSLSVNSNSNPWRRKKGGTQVGQKEEIQYFSNLSDSDVGFLGGTHYAATVSLSQLNLRSGTELLCHFTMKCGNDNLIGKTHVPDSAQTIALLGFTLFGIEIIRRTLKHA